MVCCFVCLRFVPNVASVSGLFIRFSLSVSLTFIPILFFYFQNILQLNISIMF